LKKRRLVALNPLPVRDLATLFLDLNILGTNHIPPNYLKYIKSKEHLDNKAKKIILNYHTPPLESIIK